MSGEKSSAPAPAPAADAPQPVVASGKEAAAVPVDSKTTSGDAKAAASKSTPAAAPSEDSADELAEAVAEKSTEAIAEKPDVEMADSAAPADTAATDADESAAPTSQPAADLSANATAAEPTPSKSKAKRKSVGASDTTKGKKLNKKASKARILHLDAQPGDHYFVKLKGFPQWPVIICDEDMLPQLLLKSRPVTAKRADGTYRPDYDDGAKKAADRTFPVMYLHTNEFGWVPNSDLIELDPATVKEAKTDKMRKDLQAAHDLAADHHDLAYYKNLLQQFQEDQIEKEKARAAKAAATPKGKKSQAVVDEDGDVEMADVVEEDGTPPKEKKSAKKRKAEDSAETPQRTDSVKKTKIKLTTNSTRKSLTAAEPTPKAAKAAAEGKTAKPKSKKKEPAEEKADSEPVVPKEPELTPEEKHQRKEKEVLFLRHKLQKGLLTRDQEPKEEEMKSMSDFVLKLEGFPDLEVSIIRATKINKVLKAILKLDNIPKEDEFQFKPRSQALLDTWNKLLAVDSAPAPAGGTNGVNGSKEGAKTNGVKEKSENSGSEKAKSEPKDKAANEEPPAGNKASGEEGKAPEPIEATA